MSSFDLPKQRLHPVAALISVLRTVRGLLPLLLVVLFTQREDGAPLLLIGLAFVGVSLIEGVGSWLRYSYSVRDGELVVERGFFIRQNLLIPAERVQTVDTSAGVLQRLFGLVKVEIKTAAGTQAVMSAVTQANAERLKQALGTGETSDHAAGGHAAPSAYYDLSLNELFLAASTSGRLGVLLSGVAYLYSLVDDFIEQRLMELLQAAEFDVLPTSSPWFVVGALMLGFSLAFLVSVAAEVARFSGFQVTRTGDQLVIRRGLFERREVSLSLDRIQAVRIVEGLLRQPLGYGSIIVDTAGQSEESSRSTALHPFIHRSRWQALLGDLIPQYAVTPKLVSPPRRAIRRFVLRPMLFALILALLVASSFSLGWLSFALVPLGAWFGLMSYRDAAAGADGQTLVLRERRLWRVTAIVRRRQVQLVELSSSLLQRRLRLCDLSIGVASGAGGKHLRVPNLDNEDAAELAEGSLASRLAGEVFGADSARRSDQPEATDP